MKYKVLMYFEDLQDNRYAYHEGDMFPREGLKVSKERIKELSTNANRRKQPLIQALEDIPQKDSRRPKKEPQEVETGESASKATKAKRSTKKS